MRQHLAIAGWTKAFISMSVSAGCVKWCEVVQSGAEWCKMV